AFAIGLDLVFSYIGIGAVVAFSALVLSTVAGRAFAYCGRNSIAVYLAFTVFMGPARIVLLKVTGGEGAEVVALMSTFAGVVGALMLAWMVRGTWAGFLFTRPAWARLGKQPSAPAGA